MDFYKLTIKEIKRQTPSAVTLQFNVPETLEKNFSFLAGQYVTLKITLNGKELRRAYSICAAPQENKIQVGIKAIKNGVFSSFANENLKPGDLLEVSTPEGKFNFKAHHDAQKNYAAFAAGSGITPIFSILKTVLLEEPKSSIVLVYGNKTPEETIFYKELLELQKDYLGRFFVHFVYSQSNDAGAFYGRIDKAVVQDVLKNKHGETTFDSYYLCGPEAMITTVSNTLKENNVPANTIHFELFGTAPSIENQTVAEGHTAVSILVDGEETTFEMSNKQTVLEAALKQGLDVPYSCQGGICSSCICKVTEGVVEMKKNQILSEEEIADGLTLSCQAVPTSTTLKIDFDNV